MRTLALLAIAPLALGSLASCRTVAEINRAPVLAPVELPAAHAAPVHLAAHTTHPAPPPAPGSLWSPRRHALHTGARARGVGDLLTVLVAIDDEGSFRLSTDRARANRSGRDISIAAELDGAAGPVGTADLSFGGRSTHAGDGRTRRGENVRLRVAAHVESLTANGDFVVRGTQEVRLNHELRRLTVTGIVRRRDIGPDNRVAYERMASARISYGGRGRLTEVQQPPWGQQIVDLASPL